MFLLYKDLCPQICAWPKTFKKRPPALKRETKSGTFLLKTTHFLTFLDLKKNRPAQGTHKAKVFLKKKNRPAQGTHKAKVFTQHIFVFRGGGWLQAHNIYHNQLRPHSFLAIRHLFCYVVFRKLTRAPSWLNVDKVADFSEWRGVHCSC